MKLQVRAQEVTRKSRTTKQAKIDGLEYKFVKQAKQLVAAESNLADAKRTIEALKSEIDDLLTRLTIKNGRAEMRQRGLLPKGTKFVSLLDLKDEKVSELNETYIELGYQWQRASVHEPICKAPLGCTCTCELSY